MASSQDINRTVSTRPFRFLDLPESVREEIYDYVLGSREVMMGLNRRGTVTDCMEPHLKPDSVTTKYNPDEPVAITSERLCAHWTLTGEVATQDIIGIFSGHNKTKEALAGPCWLCYSDPEQGDAPCLSRTRRIEVQLLRVCRDIYNEAADELYRSTNFVFYRHEVLEAFLEDTSFKNLSVVRNITLVTWRKGLFTNEGIPINAQWSDCLTYQQLSSLKSLQHLTVVQLGRRMMRDGFGKPGKGFTELISNNPIFGSGEWGGLEDDECWLAVLEAEQSSVNPVHLVKTVPRKRIQVQEAEDVLVGLQEEILLLALLLTDRALADDKRKRSLTVSFKAATAKPENTFDLKWAVELTKDNSKTIQEALARFVDDA